jgi:predicted dehydrogenase
MTSVLLIGIGRWGANHLRVLQQLPIDLYVAETDPKRMDQARKLGLSDRCLSSDYRIFLGRVDAVVICTPAPLHFPIAKECLEAGKDVFVEKPLALVSKDARQLSELAASRGALLQVGHIFRFDSATSWLRDAVRDGQFGRIQMLRSLFSGFKRPRNDSGVALADAIHFVDLMNYLLESTPVAVRAIYHDFLGRGQEDSALISLDYEIGGLPVWGLVEANYFLPGKNRELVITGSQMSAVCDFNVSQYKIKTYQNQHCRNGAGFVAQEGAIRQIECPPEEPLLAELRAFLAASHTRESPRADGWAGYHSVRILEAAAESARTGSTVRLT